MNDRKAAARRLLLDGLFYLIGSVLYALSVNMFTAPNDIAPGGVTGIATLLHYVDSRLPIGTTIIVINLPLLIASWRLLGRGFTVRTLLVTILSSLVIDVMAPFIPPFTGDDKLLVALFGGLLAGAGLGLIYMRGATTGGSEIVARLLERKWRHVPIGRLILLVDAVVVASSAIVYRNLSSALYATVLIFVSSRLIDAIVYGGDSGKLLLILTEKGDAIVQAIFEKMQRGVTKLAGIGAYSGENRQVLLCAVRRAEVYPLRLLVKDADPHAFVIITTTDEVIGKGFKTEE